ncbi:MAG: BBP7 family outer membrane beta-barrel protein, partial [Aeoliella sp.]
PVDFGNIINEPYLGDPAYDQWGCQPALTESTGTWLRRGWWYTEIDAVVLNRQWKRDDVTLAQDSASTRKLNLNRSDPGASGSARLTLGRFLFRDGENRDHTMEFTAYGGGEWSQDDTITADGGGNSIFVPPGISDFNTGFDQASSMSVDYSSRFTSIELNYRVKERMRHDRMELSPNGEWIRRANEGITKQYLVGLRYFDLADILDWRAGDIASQAGEDGRYLIDTNNDMFGVHLGCALLLEHDRWNVEVGGKGGAFINDSKANSDFTITNNAANSFSVGNRETTLSFIGEFQAIGRYHLRPHLSLRAGWQMMYITSVALAPDQITFAPDAGRFPHTGDPFYNGGIFGFEGYW